MACTQTPGDRPSSDRAWWIVAGLAIAYASIYSWQCVLRYRFYLYADFDLAIFAQAVDGILHGRLYTSIRGMNWLGDHSSLVLFLIAPLYALVRHPLSLLVLQSTALAAGAFPVYALGRREIQHRGLALTCAVSYLLYPALGYANLFEFHPELLATPALLASFYFLRTERSRPMLGWAGVALLCREDVALVVLGMALYALLLPRASHYRLAFGLLAEASVSAIVTWGILRPAWNHGEADYAAIYGQWGHTASQAILHMLRDPIRVLSSLVSTPGNPRDSVMKLQYYTALVAPLTGLPLLSPLTLALALPALLEHMLSWRPAQHTILCQYTALVTPFVIASAVLGMRNLRSKLASPGWTRAVMAVALAAGVAGQLVFGPLLGTGQVLLVRALCSVPPTGEERVMARLRDGMLRELPPRGGVVASFEYLPHLTARDNVTSLHYVLLGAYKFSPRPYPIPTGISALIADVAAPSVVAAAGPQAHLRLRELVRRNRLVPVAAAGDLVLMVAGARDTVNLVSSEPSPPCDGPPIGFDRELQFLGGAVVDSLARAGGLVPLRTCWRRTASVDRHFEMRLCLVDAAGKTALAHTRDLGYLLAPPHAWREAEAMRENYRLVLPDDLAPGDYRVMLTMRWRARGESGDCTPDDSALYSASQGIALGHLRVI